MFFSTDYDSPLGDMLIVSDGESICGVWFYGQKHFPLFENFIQNDGLAIFSDVKDWLDDYFRGLNPKINFKLNPKGSKFRLKVWRILSQIPYGETLTYGEIASRISPTMSAQAVGGAVGHNPISILTLLCKNSPAS
ncbi:MAG: methylated-DNA--[Methanobrevibacter sp.]|nr:methylated-DNA--[protein]-cysteine S-methyltransferase [Methanobrevibacter sp.]